MVEEAYDITVQLTPVLAEEIKFYHKIDNDLDKWLPNSVQFALEKAVKEF